MGLWRWPGMGCTPSRRAITRFTRRTRATKSRTINCRWPSRMPRTTTSITASFVSFARRHNFRWLAPMRFLRTIVANKLPASPLGSSCPFHIGPIALAVRRYRRPDLSQAHRGFFAAGAPAWTHWAFKTPVRAVARLESLAASPLGAIQRGRTTTRGRTGASQVSITKHLRSRVASGWFGWSSRC